MNRALTRLTITLCALTVLAGGVARAAPPVVAIDVIEAPTGMLSATTRRSLTLFLQARVAALPGLRVIPPKQIRAALARLARTAAQRGEANSALDLGRRLAANKVLAPRILRAGEQCVITLTLLDVRTATVERATTAQGGCAEGALAATLSAALDRLSAKLRGPAPTPPTVTSESKVNPDVEPRKPRAEDVERVSVYVSTKPPGAKVTLDGEKRGKTPVRLDLVRGGRYRLALSHNYPYEKVSRQIVAKRWQEIHVKLRYEHVDRLDLATTSEWFSFGFGGGVLGGGDAGTFAATLRVATLRWRYLFWTAGEILAGFKVSGGRDHHIASFGTRVGVPLYLGRTGRHQLLFGLGLSYLSIDNEDQDRRAFGLVPGVEYVFMATNGLFQGGAAVHALLPAASDLGDRWPYQILFTLRAGFSFTRAIRAETKASPSQPGGTSG